MICENCRGVNTSSKDTVTGQIIYKVESSKTKKGIVKTETMLAPYTLVKNDSVIVTGTTDSKGPFEIKNLEQGTYRFTVQLHKLLKSDTLIQLNRKTIKIEVSLNDSILWHYVDSINMSKFPFTKEIARQDIEAGNIKILGYGLPMLSDEELNTIASKYGFKCEGVAACAVSNYEAMAIKEYNNVMYEYLDSINEKGWKEAYREEIVEFFKNKRGVINK
jgi:hypothetical protein